MISAICTTCHREAFLKNNEQATCPRCGSGLEIIHISNKKEIEAAAQKNKTLQRISRAIDNAHNERNALISQRGSIGNFTGEERQLFEHLNYIIKYFMNAELVISDLENLLAIYAPEQQQGQLQNAS